MAEEEAKLYDLLPVLRKKLVEEAKEKSKSEPVAEMSSEIGQLMQDKGASPIVQLAALGVCGKAIRMAIAAYHGEQVATKAVEKAFALSQQYEPEWVSGQPLEKSWQQVIFETGKCPLCEKLVEGPAPDGSFSVRHEPHCPIVPKEGTLPIMVRPSAGKEDK